MARKATKSLTWLLVSTPLSKCFLPRLTLSIFLFLPFTSDLDDGQCGFLFFPEENRTDVYNEARRNDYSDDKLLEELEERLEGYLRKVSLVILDWQLIL